MIIVKLESIGQRMIPTARVVTISVSVLIVERFSKKSIEISSSSR